MKNQCQRKVLLIMVLWLSAPPFLALAIDPVIDRATLSGIRSVYVTVSGLSPKIQRDGLTAEEIQTDVKQKLGTAGIKILTRERFMNSRGAPWLRLHVSITKMDGIHAYSAYISIECLQAVHLVRDPSVVTVVSTWSKTGLATISHLGEVRTFIGKGLEEFLNAWSLAKRK